MSKKNLYIPSVQKIQEDLVLAKLAGDDFEIENQLSLLLTKRKSLPILRSDLISLGASHANDSNQQE